MAIVLLLIGAGLPAIIGLHLFTRSRGDDLTRMAAWLTIKPFLTTPLCMLIFAAVVDRSANSPNAVVAIVPGVIATVIIVSRYSSLVFGPLARPSALLLLALDCLRWGSTLALLLLLSMSQPAGQSAFSDIIAAAASISAMLMPLVFALAAYFVVRLAGSPQNSSLKHRRKRGEDALDELDE